MSVCDFGGNTPHFLKLAMIFTGVKEQGQASPTRNANLSLVTTLPGLAARYLLHASEK